MTTQTALAPQLEAQMKSTAQKLPQEIVDLILNSIVELKNSRIDEGGLQVGATAPDFELPDPTGQRVKLSTLLANGPVVLSFYRGEWCPYCNLEIRALQQMLPDFQQYNAQIVAISPEQPDNSLTLQEKHDLRFPVLSDSGNAVARSYGLIFALDPSLHPIYKDFGIDLPARNGDESYELPIPATYVVDRNRVIRYAYVNADYTQRAEPGEVLAAVRQL